jgi:SAM-dependent methyltransferase
MRKSSEISCIAHHTLEEMYDDETYKAIPVNLIAKDAIWKLVKEYTFKTVLDLGAGSGSHSKFFSDNGKNVVAIIAYDLNEFDKRLLAPESENNIRLVIADYQYYKFHEKFDLIWASHILEHQRNIGIFLDKIWLDLKNRGILALSVPFAESVAGGGHINYFGSGHLIYHLLEAGFDLSDIRMKVDGWNLSIIVRKDKYIKPNRQNFTNVLLSYKNRLPGYINNAILDYIRTHTYTYNGNTLYDERIPLELQYKW